MRMENKSKDKLEDKIEMLQKCHLVAESMANPRHQPVDMHVEYDMMIEDIASTYNISKDSVFSCVKLEQMYIEDLVPTQLKLNLGYDEHKIYQEIR